jgi:pimeloyl-ACP methyl ester carboxylesterase
VPAVRPWRPPLGGISLALLLAIAVVLGFAGVRVQRTLRPEPTEPTRIDFESMRIPMEQVRFQAADGVRLEGWSVAGRPDMPTIILCHDLGSRKESLINLALALQESGFSLLLFDFRGHGESESRSSTLGLHEKRDILGAVDFLAEEQRDDSYQLGLYGVGMGAHAAVLAAADRPRVKVLVLDGLYPDASYPLLRGVYADWSFGSKHMGLLPRGLFRVMSGASISEQRAADIIEHLLGRDMLLLAPAGDAMLAAEMERMYTTIPDQPDVDGNLVVVPASQSEGLYGDQLSRYHERVSQFFTTRLVGSIAPGRSEDDSS